MCWGDRLLRFPSRVRISKLPQGEFVASVRLIRLGRSETSILSPFPLDAWRSIVVRFNLDTSLTDWRCALNSPKARLIEVRQDLVAFFTLDIRTFAEEVDLAGRVVSLRQTCRSRIVSNAKHAIIAPVAMRQILLAEAIRGADLADSAFPRRHGGLRIVRNGGRLYRYGSCVEDSRHVAEYAGASEDGANLGFWSNN